MKSPFNTSCLIPIDYVLLIAMGAIGTTFILTVTISLIKWLHNLGRYTFRIILDSINGLIDLGIPEGLTMLHMSARAGNTPGCRKIMRWKPDYYNKITIHGESALSFAAQKGHKETCEMIIKMSRELAQASNFKTIEMTLHQARVV